MTIYERLLGSLQSQDRYEVHIADTREDAERTLRDLRNIVIYHQIWLTRRNKKQRRTRRPGEDISAEERQYNDDLDLVDRWIAENVGLKPAYTQRWEFQRGDTFSPKLVYREDLPDTRIIIRYTNSKDQEEKRELQGKATLEVIITCL